VLTSLHAAVAFMHSPETAGIGDWIAEAVRGGSQGHRALAGLVLLAAMLTLKRAMPFFRGRHRWALPWVGGALAAIPIALAGLRAGLPWYRIVGGSFEVLAGAVLVYEMGWKRVERAIKRRRTRKALRREEGVE
jgi:hypothetical protein